MLKLLLLACTVAAAYAQSCGNPAIPPNVISPLIVGGTTAVPHSWPWMVEIIKDGGHYCGGTLINSEWVVSAAHCYSVRPQLNRYQFSVGGHLENTLTEPTRQTRDAVEIIRHEAYSAITSSNDIALIKLSSPVFFDDNVSPACVADKRPSDGDVVWVTGWGDQEVNPYDEELQQVDVPIVSQDTCQTAYPQYEIDASMICAGYANGGKDSCQGDSGGPVVKKVDNYWNLVGITSWGIGCADAGYYGVYSDVSFLKSWIDSTIAANP